MPAHKASLCSSSRQHQSLMTDSHKKLVTDAEWNAVVPGASAGAQLLGQPELRHRSRRCHNSMESRRRCNTTFLCRIQQGEDITATKTNS